MMLQAQTLSPATAFPVLAPVETKARPVEVVRKGSWALTSLTILFALMLIAAVHPGIRAKLHGTLLPEHHTVISTVHGDLVSNGVELTVAKVRKGDALYLEIYEPKSNGGQRLMERIELPDRRDGYFNFNGEATTLAIDDIDGDGKLEILVPSFDANLVGHLNIYRFDESSGMFTRAKM